MSFFRYCLLFVILYVCAVLQTSFLVHFAVGGFVLNVVLLVVIGIAFIQPQGSLFPMAAAASGGFFLDVFSGKPFGYYLVILFVIALSIQIIIRRYVSLPFLEKR